jgi:hypothetical protein
MGLKLRMTSEKCFITLGHGVNVKNSFYAAPTLWTNKLDHSHLLLFHPSLIFASKDGVSFKDKHSSLFERNDRDEAKNITLTTGPNVIKLFTAVIYECT